MKAQFDVDDDLWRVIRVDALRQGKTMGEVIDPVLRKKWGAGQGAQPPTIVSGSARMNSEVTGKSERDRQMEESPPVKVNPSTPTPRSKPDPACKHSFAMKPSGGSKCVKCGWEP